MAAASWPVQIALGIARHRTGKPAGVRLGPDEHEERRCRNGRGASGGVVDHGQGLEAL